MQMTGEYRIEAPREAVWTALNDPEVLRQCIPGCEALEKTSDTAFSAKVNAKVGPVSAMFAGSVHALGSQPAAELQNFRRGPGRRGPASPRAGRR